MRSTLFAGRLMRDDYDAFKEGFAKCAEIAEDFAVTVFLPGGGTAKAVLVNDIVRLRQMPRGADGVAG